jgi:hypothetical protein
MQEVQIRLTFAESVLGTVPKNPEVYRRFVESKRPKDSGPEEDEAATVLEVEERGWTGFHQDVSGLFIYDYQLKGALKELAGIAYPKGGDLSAARSKVENFVYVRPRRLRFRDDAGLILAQPDGVVERPLRAMTAQGPRVSVMRSDFVAAGRTLEATIVVVPGPVSQAMIERILRLGEYRGLGQFRTGSYGLFTFAVLNGIPALR